MQNALLLVNCPCHQSEQEGFSNESFPFAKTVVCLRTTGTAVPGRKNNGKRYSVSNKMAMAREQTTRQKLLVYMKKQGTVDVQQLAEHLQMTKVAVRKHLDLLHREHYVEASIMRRRIGRPVFVYKLTPASERLFPTHYDEWVTELMENVEELFGESHVAMLFERRMKRIQQKYREQMAGQSFEERLDTLAKLQDADGYMVKLEQKADGVYSFIETNCPIARVASEFPQACQCEWSLFASLFNDAQVDRTECIAEGGTCCRYLLTKKQQT